MKLTLLTANLCLPDGTGNTLVPVPTCLASLAICYPFTVQVLLWMGVSSSFIGWLLVASLVHGLWTNMTLMHAVHWLVGPPAAPADGKAALAFAHSQCQTTTGEALSGWWLESSVVLATPIMLMLVVCWAFDPSSWLRQVVLCVAGYQLCLLLFAWVGQALNWIATVLDLWFTRQYKEERIDLLISRIEHVDADVVCLQEAIPMVWCTEYMERYAAHHRVTRQRRHALFWYSAPRLGG
jgi:hypothetical protein